MFRISACVIISVLLSHWAFAQENEEEKVTHNWSAHTGPFLPNQIEGIEEIQPTWGVRYAFPFRKNTHLEFGAANSNAEGVELVNGTVSLRGDFPIEDLLMVAYIGVDTLHYRAPNAEEVKNEVGGHVGGGFLAHIADVVWFRSDMKFAVNPGTSLYIGFGLEFQIPSAGDDDEEEQPQN